MHTSEVISVNLLNKIGDCLIKINENEINLKCRTQILGIAINTCKSSQFTSVVNSVINSWRSYQFIFRNPFN